MYIDLQTLKPMDLKCSKVQRRFIFLGKCWDAEFWLTLGQHPTNRHLRETLPKVMI